MVLFLIAIPCNIIRLLIYKFIYKKLILSLKLLHLQVYFGNIPFFFFFYLCKNYYNKKIFIIIALLFLEPIILFSISGKVIIQIRYFSGLICLVYLLQAIILQDILIRHEAKNYYFLYYVKYSISYQKFNVKMEYGLNGK